MPPIPPLDTDPLCLPPPEQTLTDGTEHPLGDNASLPTTPVQLADTAAVYRRCIDGGECPNHVPLLLAALPPAVVTLVSDAERSFAAHRYREAARAYAEAGQILIEMGNWPGAAELFTLALDGAMISNDPILLHLSNLKLATALSRKVEQQRRNGVPSAALEADQLCIIIARQGADEAYMRAVREAVDRGALVIEGCLHAIQATFLLERGENPFRVNAFFLLAAKCFDKAVAAMDRGHPVPEWTGTTQALRVEQARLYAEWGRAQAIIVYKSAIATWNSLQMKVVLKEMITNGERLEILSHAVASEGHSAALYADARRMQIQAIWWLALTHMRAMDFQGAHQQLTGLLALAQQDADQDLVDAVSLWIERTTVLDARSQVGPVDAHIAFAEGLFAHSMVAMEDEVDIPAAYRHGHDFLQEADRAFTNALKQFQSEADRFSIMSPQGRALRLLVCEVRLRLAKVFIQKGDLPEAVLRLDETIRQLQEGKERSAQEEAMLARLWWRRAEALDLADQGSRASRSTRREKVGRLIPLGPRTKVPPEGLSTVPPEERIVTQFREAARANAGTQRRELVRRVAEKMQIAEGEAARQLTQPDSMVWRALREVGVDSVHMVGVAEGWTRDHVGADPHRVDRIDRLDIFEDGKGKSGR